MERFRMTAQVLLEILIPTYNRCSDLTKNIAKLVEMATDAGSLGAVKILVSDNCSTDQTEKAVNELMLQNPEWPVEYWRNSENIGLEANAVSVFSRAKATHVMFLGDDDFLANGYLKYCLDQIAKNNNLGCIIPGLSSLFADGSVKEGRKELFSEVHLPAGFAAAKQYSHLGHQMSGLVVRTDGLLQSYLQKPEYRNPYLFLYFLTNRLVFKGGIYAPSYKTLVNVSNTKDWGYNGIGLLDEVYKCYYSLEGDIGSKSVVDLIVRFTTVHSYRLAFDSGNPLLLLRQYRELVSASKPLPGLRTKLLVVFVKDGGLSVANRILDKTRAVIRIQSQGLTGPGSKN